MAKNNTLKMFDPSMIPDFNQSNLIWVSEFDSDSARDFCASIFKASEEDEGKPIFVYINSGGGDVSGLLAMLTAMDSVPNKIVTIAMGYAMSAGALLLAHGAIRCVSPHARVMVHKIQAGAFGSMDDILNETEELVRLNSYVLGILAKDCKRPLTEIEEALSGNKREIYLSADGAVKFGLADMVGIPKLAPVAPASGSWNVMVNVPQTPEPTKKKAKAKK